MVKALVQEPFQLGGGGGKDLGVERKHNEGQTPNVQRRTPNVQCRQDRESVCISSHSRYVPRSFMAKMSWINRNERKRATVKKYAALRAELKAKKDYMGLSQLPRDASPTRVVNRCEVSGRRRAFIRRFKISRLTFRELASGGFIPGVTKSSW